MNLLRRLVDNRASAGGRSALMGGASGPISCERYCEAVAERWGWAAEKWVGHEEEAPAHMASLLLARMPDLGSARWLRLVALG